MKRDDLLKTAEEVLSFLEDKDLSLVEKRKVCGRAYNLCNLKLKGSSADEEVGTRS